MKSRNFTGMSLTLPVLRDGIQLILWLAFSISTSVEEKLSR